MKRTAITIVFNGAHHLLNQFSGTNGGDLLSSMDKWIFVEGASSNTFCTSWCNAMPSEYHNNGRSVDKTLDILNELKSNWKNVEVITKDGFWDGKVNMFNEALKRVTEPCWLWEVDVDEYWTTDKMKCAETLLENTNADTGAFMCDYLLSPNITVRGEWGESCGHGYRRLWSYKPGMQFTAHEPPVLNGCNRILPPKFLPKFKHLSYYYEEEVMFKSKWYGKHERVYEGWLDIKTGKQKLPCKVSALFKRDDLPKEWMDSIVTYL